jgi:hypothetical protein
MEQRKWAETKARRGVKMKGVNVESNKTESNDKTERERERGRDKGKK